MVHPVLWQKERKYIHFIATFKSDHFFPLFLPNLIEQNSSGYSQGENGVKNAFRVAVVDKSDHRK